MMLSSTLISCSIEGEDSNLVAYPSVILQKPSREVTLFDVRQCYSFPQGIFLFKTLEDVELIYGENPEEQFHWTIITNDNHIVPSYGDSIVAKIRPFSFGFQQIDEDNHPVHEYTNTLPDNEDNEEEADSKKKGATYACSIEGCDKVFNKPWRLKSHMRNHTGEKKPHICTYSGCNKSFNESQALRNHLRVHTGEKPYECTIPGCTKRFSEKTNLRKHLRLHTGEKPYPCTYEGCGRSFGRSDQLKVHMSDHTGIKPYHCNYPNCDKSFSYSSGLKVHLRVHQEKGDILE